MQPLRTRCERLRKSQRCRLRGRIRGNRDGAFEGFDVRSVEREVERVENDTRRGLSHFHIDERRACNCAALQVGRKLDPVVNGNNVLRQGANRCLGCRERRGTRSARADK
jgi:hypothetical protein